MKLKILKRIIAVLCSITIITTVTFHNVWAVELFYNDVSVNEFNYIIKEISIKLNDIKFESESQLSLRFQNMRNLRLKILNIIEDTLANLHQISEICAKHHGLTNLFSGQINKAYHRFNNNLIVNCYDDDGEIDLFFNANEILKCLNDFSNDIEKIRKEIQQ